MVNSFKFFLNFTAEKLIIGNEEIFKAFRFWQRGDAYNE